VLSQIREHQRGPNKELSKGGVSEKEGRGNIQGKQKDWEQIIEWEVQNRIRKF